MRLSQCIVSSIALLVFTSSAYAVDHYKAEPSLRSGPLYRGGKRACFNYFIPGGGASDPFEACSAEDISKEEIAELNVVLKKSAMTSEAVSAFLITQPFSEEVQPRYGQKHIDYLIANPDTVEFKIDRTFTLSALTKFAKTFAVSGDAHNERLRQLELLTKRIQELEKQKSDVLENDRQFVQ